MPNIKQKCEAGGLSDPNLAEIYFQLNEFSADLNISNHRLYANVKVKTHKYFDCM